MRRILYVWNYREWGGAQIYFLSLMKAAREVADPFQVQVMVPEDSDARVLKYLADLDVPARFVGAAPPAVGTAKSFVGKLRHRIRVYRSENRLVTRILKELEDQKAAESSGLPIVHIDLGFWQSYRALSRLLRCANVFVTQHTALVDPGGIRGLFWRLKGKRISRSPNFVVLASNNDAKNSLRPFLRAEKFNAIRVTYTGIDPDEIASVTPVVESNTHDRSLTVAGGFDRRPVVMTVGQFIERKGCWVVLDALQNLRDAGENVQFLWLGTSALDTETVERINGYHLGDRFRFLSAEEIGPSRHDLLGLLGTANTFVLASFREGLPIALVEAMALGLPCIASGVGAIPEAIDHNASGLLVTPGDADDLAEAISTLVNDPETRKMFGTAGRAVAFEKFNQKTTAEETVRIYDKVWKTSA